jgi:hypothetical protein
MRYAIGLIVSYCSVRGVSLNFAVNPSGVVSCPRFCNPKSGAEGFHICTKYGSKQKA